MKTKCQTNELTSLFNASKTASISDPVPFSQFPVCSAASKPAISSMRTIIGCARMTLTKGSSFTVTFAKFPVTTLGTVLFCGTLFETMTIERSVSRRRWPRGRWNYNASQGLSIPDRLLQ